MIEVTRIWEINGDTLIVAYTVESAISIYKQKFNVEVETIKMIRASNGMTMIAFYETPDRADFATQQKNDIVLCDDIVAHYPRAGKPIPCDAGPLYPKSENQG